MIEVNTKINWTDSLQFVLLKPISLVLAVEGSTSVLIMSLCLAGSSLFGGWAMLGKISIDVSLQFGEQYELTGRDRDVNELFDHGFLLLADLQKVVSETSLVSIQSISERLELWLLHEEVKVL